jgi:hypothetical protein
MKRENKKRSLDRDHLLHETFKQLTTLSSAAILLIATLMVKGGFQETRSVGRALIFLLVSNFASIFVMLLLSTDSQATLAYRIALFASICISVMAFEGALFSVLYFTWSNFGF